jgi:alanyl-tRNA synthetase
LAKGLQIGYNRLYSAKTAQAHENKARNQSMKAIPMQDKPKSVSEIRKAFLDFYQAKGHEVVQSSPLVPAGDPTLMFTNSGMVQFKDVFLGADVRSYKRAASVQACLRAGGKHNDLENVGYTARHHTFFEMMGNWSFGDYFKRDSLMWGWELLTKVYGLPEDKLMATVYHEDDEAYDIWTQVIGLPPERVVRIGDNKGKKYASDNFWMMADTGPCGPCSEIFYDHGEHIAGGPPGSPGEDGDRFIEIWNHVFMQFDMQADGSLKKLPAPCVDTGMGLERLAAILQNVHSNYEIDLMDGLVKAAARETGCQDLNEKSLRVIADHARAVSFLLAEGVAPGSDGRGFVLRRIMRRAIRHGHKLGMKTPFLSKIVPDLVKAMGDAYPALKVQKERIMASVLQEESRFHETLGHGMAMLDEALSSGTKTLPGSVAFKLHDTYGFPLDLTKDACRDKNVSVDEAGFFEAMQAQKDLGRASGKFKSERAMDYAGPATQFVGYERLAQEGARVLALFSGGVSVDELQEGAAGVVVLDTTPFYAQGGGQAGDKGALERSLGDMKFMVSEATKLGHGATGHQGVVSLGRLRVGDLIDAKVDQEARSASAMNHSATHLMQRALREMLGDSVEQRGSMVDESRSRFDFAHGSALSAEQIAELERRVNGMIMENAASKATVVDMDEAKRMGAMMLFGEKYGEQVRVMKIGRSVELCGGTHVERAGDMGLFKVIEQSAVGAGVRRIEATTGASALRWVQSNERELANVAALVKAPLAEVAKGVDKLAQRAKALERELSAARVSLVEGVVMGLSGKAQEPGHIGVVSAIVENVDVAALRAGIDASKAANPWSLTVLASVVDGRAQFAVGSGKALGQSVDCALLASHLASQVGGKGGGKPDMAMAGGPDVSNMKAALESVKTWVGQLKGPAGQSRADKPKPM